MTDAVGGLTAVRALADIRVVDLSTGVAGPLAAMMLADFGADVVKVEPPSGDPGRSRPGFAMWNRSKRRLTIDAEATPDRLLDLLAVADVCVSGGGAGGLADHVDADAACQASMAHCASLRDSNSRFGRRPIRNVVAQAASAGGTLEK